MDKKVENVKPIRGKVYTLEDLAELIKIENEDNTDDSLDGTDDDND